MFGTISTFRTSAWCFGGVAGQSNFLEIGRVYRSESGESNETHN